MSLRRIFLAAAVAAATIAPATADTVSAVAVPGVGEVPVKSFDVFVVAVDPAKREVRVKTRNGNEYAYQIAPIVGPLDSLQKNDEVEVSIVPGAVSDIEKAQSGTPGLIEQDVLDTSIFASLPENFYATSITANVTLVAIDPAARTVTFEGFDGQVRTMPAANDEVAQDFAGVEPGDLFQITWFEAMAFDVEE